MKLKRSFIFKRVFLLFLLSTPLFAEQVLVTLKDIKFKERIDRKFLTLYQMEVPYNCTPLKLEELDKGDFTATRFILKNRVLCANDVKLDAKESVIFDFGSLEIEQEGRVIFENDSYIRVKRKDGKVEKIYKDGKRK